MTFDEIEKKTDEEVEKIIQEGLPKVLQAKTEEEQIDELTKVVYKAIYIHNSGYDIII